MLQPREEHATLHEIGTVPVQTTNKWFHGIRGTAEESKLKGRTWMEGKGLCWISFPFRSVFFSSFSRSTNSLSCLSFFASPFRSAFSSFLFFLTLPILFSLSFRFSFLFLLSFLPTVREEVQLGRLRSMWSNVILRTSGWCVFLISFLDCLSHEFYR